MTMAADERFGRIVGGRLCLDFVNTVRGRVRRTLPRRARDYADVIVGERLTSYDALVNWSVMVGVLTERDGAGLKREASSKPAEAHAVLARAITLREAIYRLFKATMKGWTPQADDVSTLAGEVQEARAHERLTASPRFHWEWDPRRDALDRLLWPVVRSAEELLTGPEVARVGQCPGDGCGWLFLDTSRSRRRQWCHMGDCGTLAKVRRFRQKRREVRV